MPLPDPLPIFELLVLMTDELPQLCVGVQESLQQQNEQQLKFDIIHLNGTPNPQPGKWLTDCWSCMNSGLKNCTTNITFKPIPMNSTDFSLSVKIYEKHTNFVRAYYVLFIDTCVCVCVNVWSLCLSLDSETVRAVQVTQLDRDTVLIALESMYDLYVWLIHEPTSKACTDTCIVN